MKNNYIYNILIFILILALLIIFINNLYIIEGSQNQGQVPDASTSETREEREARALENNKTYYNDYTVDTSIIDNNPGDASRATDSRMLDGAENTPKLMDDGDLNTVYNAIDQIENTLVNNLRTAYNSVDGVVLPQTLKIRNDAYEFLSFRDSNHEPIVASDLDTLRQNNRKDVPFELESNGRPPNNLNSDIRVKQNGDYEYMSNMNMTAKQEKAFYSNKCLPITRTESLNIIPTTVTEDDSFEHTAYGVEKRVKDTDLISGRLQGSLGLTCNSKQIPNKNDKILSTKSKNSIKESTTLRAKAGI